MTFICISIFHVISLNCYRIPVIEVVFHSIISDHSAASLPPNALDEFLEPYHKHRAGQNS